MGVIHRRDRTRDRTGEDLVIGFKMSIKKEELKTSWVRSLMKSYRMMMMTMMCMMKMISSKSMEHSAHRKVK